MGKGEKKTTPSPRCCGEARFVSQFGRFAAERRCIPAQAGAVTSIAAACSSNRSEGAFTIVTVVDGKGATVWNAATRTGSLGDQPKATLPAVGGAASLVVAPEADGGAPVALVAPHANGGTAVWSLATGEPSVTHGVEGTRRHAAAATDGAAPLAAVMPDGATCVAVVPGEGSPRAYGEHGPLAGCDEAAGSGHVGAVTALVASPAGANPCVATGGADGGIRLWKVDQAGTNLSFRGEYTGAGAAHDDAVVAMTVSPDGSILCSADAGGAVKLWDITASEEDAPKFLYQLPRITEWVPEGEPAKPNDERVVGVSFNPMRYWSCVATDKSVEIVDLETKQFVEQITLSAWGDVTISAQCWSNDGHSLLLGLSDGRVHTVDVEGYLCYD